LDNDLLILKANQVPVFRVNGIADIVHLRFILMLLPAFHVVFHPIVQKTIASRAAKQRSRVR
jgi:hypothetical protein